MFGADIDYHAQKYLGLIPQSSQVRLNFHTADFLSMRAADFGVAFEAIIGNPPYVRHHALSPSKIQAGQSAIGPTIKLSSTASYWAYFVLHSMSFLKAGGRLGMVLPGAFLAADYAEPVRAHLRACFATVQVGFVEASMFGDAQERCMVLLADGFGGTSRGCELFLASSLRELAAYCQGKARRTATAVSLASNNWKRAFLSKEQAATYDRIAGRSDVRPLGWLAKIRIGVVTGANEFFVLEPEKARQLRLPASSLLPIVTSARDFRGLSLEPEPPGAASCPRLLAYSTNSRSGVLREYVRSRAALAVRGRLKCQKRDPWYAIEDTRASDAFLTYISHSAPRLVLNRARFTCTNAVHRLWWKRRTSKRRERFWALASLTSLCGASCELFGRSPGGGALKLEPRDAAKILLACPARIPAGLASAFRDASKAVGDADWRCAREIADDYILRRCLRIKPSAIRLLQEAHDALRRVRMRTAAPSPNR